MSRTFAIDCNNCGKIHGVGQQPVLILANSFPIKVSDDKVVVVWDLDGYKCPICGTVHLDSRSSELVWKATGQEGDIPQWIIRRKFGLTLKYGTMPIPYNEKYKDDDVYMIRAEMRPFVKGENFTVYTLEIPVKAVPDTDSPWPWPMHNVRGVVNLDNLCKDDKQLQQFADNLQADNPAALKEAMASLKEYTERLLGDVSTSRIPRIFNHRLSSLEPTTKEITNLASQMDKLLNIEPDAKIQILGPKSIEGNL
jgi:hypothetical protein